MKKITLFFLGIFLSFPLIQSQTWTQIGQDIDGETTNYEFGFSVSLSSDGSIIAVGAPGNSESNYFEGNVYVYQNKNGTWTQIGKTIVGERIKDFSGGSVSLSADGSVVAIGAPNNNGKGFHGGHVRVYQNKNGSWTPMGQDINGEAAGDNFGRSVCLNSNGTIVAIGAVYNAGNGSNAGHVCIYRYQNGKWSQIGQDIDGEDANNFSGASISLSSDGTILAIGAPYNEGNGSWAGHVRIYRYINGAWKQIGKDIDSERDNDCFGVSVSLSSEGSVVAIGANYNYGSGPTSGHVRVFKNLNGTWTQIGQDIDGEAPRDESGIRVSLNSNGTVVVIGARCNSDNGKNAGHVRIYKLTNGSWIQVGQDIDGEAAHDTFGYAVSLSSDGSVVAIGACRNDGNGINAGHVRIFKLNGTKNEE